MAQISSTKQKKKSRCEKSILLVANIIKLSTLSFATVNFGTASVRNSPQAVEDKKKKKKKKASSSPANEVAETKDLMVLERSRNHKSQEPESGSRPSSYSILEPQKLTQKEEDIDDRAADFIWRTREKIKKSHDLNATKCKLPCISEAPNIVREVSLSS